MRQPELRADCYINYGQRSNSFSCDYIAREKTPGSHLNVTIFSQLPVPVRDSAYFLSSHVLRSVLELSYVVAPLAALALDYGYDGPPFLWDEERRFLIRCELDATFFHLYLGSEEEWNTLGTPELLRYFPTPRHAVEYIMETFPIVKRKDEQAHGRYRTKDTILEIYDEMARVMVENAVAVAAGRQPTARYQTRLNPPPGPHCDAEGNFIPMSQWDIDHWPSHIHQPRPAAVPAVAVEQVQLGRAVLYINLLLNTVGRPVVRESLEAGLVFMLNDGIRQKVLSGVQPVAQTRSGQRGQIVIGMDSVLSNMKANGVVDTRIESGRMVVCVGRQPASVANAPAADVTRAEEAIQAVQKLGESRALSYCAEMSDVEYAIQ